MELRSKVALVTGGGTGIGRACALGFAQRGARAIAITYSRSADEAVRTADEIAAAGAEVLVLQCDVRIEAEVKASVDAVVRRFGGLDILVNNAGITRFIPLKTLEAVSDDVWDEIMDTNLRGTFYCCRAASAALTAAKGAIVNIGSLAGLRGAGSSVPYSISKAGVIHMTRVLAVALAPLVRVNSVSPGFVRTRWLERGLGAGVTDREAERVIAHTPLARAAEPEDVADAVMGLIGSDLVTGQDIVLDGGRALTYD